MAAIALLYARLSNAGPSNAGPNDPAAESVSTETPASGAHNRRDPLTIDTPILALLADPRTRPMLERHLPSLTQRLLNDQSVADLLGGSSPRELAADRHVRGITAEILAQLQADLLAAQTPPQDR